MQVLAYNVLLCGKRTTKLVVRFPEIANGCNRLVCHLVYIQTRAPLLEDQLSKKRYHVVLSQQFRKKFGESKHLPPSFFLSSVLKGVYRVEISVGLRRTSSSRR